MIVNRANLTTIGTAFKAAFQGALSQAPSQYRDVSTVVPSNTSAEEYGWMGSLPNVREWLGDRVVHGITSYGYTIRNRSFELTVGVPRTSIEDDQFGVYTPMMAELGRAAGAHPDQLVFELLKAGRVQKGFDNVPFYSAAHPVILKSGKDGTASNVDDSGGGTTFWHLFDLSRSIRPMIFQERKAANFVAKLSETDDNVFDRNEYVWGVDTRRNAGFGLWQMAQSSNKVLDEISFEANLVALTSRTGDHGRPLGLQATHLLVPPTLEIAARKLLRGINDAGAENVFANRVQLIVSPWLL